ncbi:geranylgeranylglyceryl phosphate synthase [Methanococcus vannielii SB]|jgi:phosphoglycerol geranylgeranyltransferase|uniref:Geranylgeranylglyceryl phosphate synthase n=1 Tax=Methanococcus vannielii (strain ATCC 35089 / DSM 1224 / JCM 13029 / OCM 148 / SB) TaxID=406327 RepID=GGGPS_METVS|nr:geranylgeranylglyceryl/heptaprenylglyceryl phosphate synthase [Methanococcus vannielii]A6URI9.1 RecName: Full=Geranylgeranylglyceryl phosphate synthase; Short=GGGP synthase; Short=GGGPS; AltName: Full=(S)-3-O-geranylgeranylglyceryl phosphate synthase; AltName: Full=Phosphoglycerol geranylgeranyltransferase [Methanococcus vannielii SB]ABR55111.1 geranylgeranylglyceryl phosphate synthase [Methanococcus vannielii SB]
MDLKIGKIETELNNILKKEGALYFVLIDPDEKNYAEVAEKVKDYADAIIIGGSIGITNLDEVTKNIKKITNLPVILFPGNVDGVTKEADAVLFMSLMNSKNTYWNMTAPTLGALTIKKYGLEAIPMAYLGIEPISKTAVGFVGEVNEIPQKKPEIASIYCLSASYFGMRWAYLEAGSGAEFPVSNEMILISKKLSGINLIVGGGIRSPDVAYEKVISGADVIVTGTLTEKNPDAVKEMKEAIKRAGKDKLKNKN